MKDAVVRPATRADLPGILGVEAAWPEDQRAGADVFEARLDRFAAGVIVSEVAGRVVGVCTSCPVRYDPDAPFHTWGHATNDGYIRPLRDVPDANALYVVSNGLLPEARRSGLRERQLQAQFAVAARHGFPCVVTGAMLPGYDAWCRAHGELPATAYAALTRDGEPVDPTLRRLRAIGFVLPDDRHVVPGYYPSPESRDHGVLLVYRVGDP